jgi:hypothetical protein
MARFNEATACDNTNHRRTDPPVGHCPTCGEVVNARIPRRQCSESDHAAARRDRSAYCVDCGARLISDR